MSRPLRFIPPGGALVEVTSRTLQGRFLLKPGTEANRRILGVLGRSLRRHSAIRLHAYTFLSNHYHLLLSIPDAPTLAAFMGYLNSNLGRELGRLYGWREKFWGRRYRAIPVSNEEKAQVERIDYFLGQACKEGLIAKPRQWPGVTWVHPVLSGREDVGIWRRRAEEYEARRQGNRSDPRDFSDREVVPLSPVPCWSHLSPAIYRSRVQQRIAQIERATYERHRKQGTHPLGRKAILRQNPHRRPKHLKRSPAPRFHCASRRARQRFWTAYNAFVESFRWAVDQFKKGQRNVTFPDGAFLPPIPLLAPG